MTLALLIRSWPDFEPLSTKDEVEHSRPISVINPVLRLCQRNFTERSDSLSSCRRHMCMLELAAVAQALRNLQDVVGSDVRLLRGKFSSEPDFLSQIASRSRAWRVLCSNLTSKIPNLVLRAQSRLPQSLLIISTRAMNECLMIAEGQLKILDELDHVVNERREAPFRALQIKLTSTQIDESRKAMKQADTVARLTMLAFIYIPTSCVCGVFGMNIVETPNGFPLWVFGLTLAVTLITTLWVALPGPRNMFLIQYQFYWLKGFVYDHMDEISWVFQWLVSVVTLPGKIQKAYKRKRREIADKVQKGRHVQPGSHRLWARHDARRKRSPISPWPT
jgi:CorA-like Mg2+ transporter protein